MEKLELVDFSFSQQTGIESPSKGTVSDGLYALFSEAVFEGSIREESSLEEREIDWEEPETKESSEGPSSQAEEKLEAGSSESGEQGESDRDLKEERSTPQKPVSIYERIQDTLKNL